MSSVDTTVKSESTYGIQIINNDARVEGPAAIPPNNELFYVHLVRELRNAIVHAIHSQCCSEPTLCRHRNPVRFAVLLPALAKFNESIIDTGAQFEFVLENQRGFKCFGIPVFSSNLLIPWFDPPTYQSLRGTGLMISENRIVNYPLPDNGWAWKWDTWYVLMIHDMDDEGWMYLHICFSDLFRWSGQYRFGKFVRRRIWIRARGRRI